MLDEIKNEKFSRKIIYLLAQMENISETILSDFYATAGFKPNINSWISFLSKFVLSLGVLFTLSGVLFFFQEGDADLYSRASFGGIKVAKNGDSILFGLFDENRNEIIKE